MFAYRLPRSDSSSDMSSQRICSLFRTCFPSAEKQQCVLISFFFFFYMIFFCSQFISLDNSAKSIQKIKGHFRMNVFKQP
jgi:hypothetical protein